MIDLRKFFHTSSSYHFVLNAFEVFDRCSENNKQGPNALLDFHF